MKSHLIGLFFLITVTSFGQSGYGQLTIGLNTGLNASDMIFCSDSTLMMVCYDSTNASKQIVLIRTDTAGAVIWQKKVQSSSLLGGAQAVRIRQMTDEGFCIAARFFPNAQHETIGIVKVDSTGDFLWATEIKPGGSIYKDAATDIIESSTGDLLVTGYYFDWLNQINSFLVKINQLNGGLIWFKKIPVNNSSGLRLFSKNDSISVAIRAGLNANDFPGLVFFDPNGIIYRINLIRNPFLMNLKLEDADRIYGTSWDYHKLLLSGYDTNGLFFSAQCWTYSDSSILGDLVRNYKINHKVQSVRYTQISGCDAGLLSMTDTSSLALAGEFQTVGPASFYWGIDTVFKSNPVAVQVKTYNAFLQPDYYFILGNIHTSTGQSGVIYTVAPSVFLYNTTVCNSDDFGLILDYLWTTDSLLLIPEIDVTGAAWVNYLVFNSVVVNFQSAFVCTPASAQELTALDTRVQLYPIPAYDKLYIDIHEEIYGANFVLYDLNGKTCFSSILQNDHNSLDVSCLPPSLYFCRIQKGDYSYSGKILLRQD